MQSEHSCPICLNYEFEKYKDRKCEVVLVPELGETKYSCDICGDFTLGDITESIINNLGAEISMVKRAGLSHILKLNTIEGKENQLYQQELDFKELLEKISLPSPWLQSIAILRLIGDAYNRDGIPLKKLPIDTHSIIGSPNRRAVIQLIDQLVSKNLLIHYGNNNYFGTIEYRNYYLTIEGWKLLEEEAKGKISSNYGFIALKFNDKELEKLVKNTIKPIGVEIGYEIIDLTDRGQAGIIDNILRNTIHHSAFVLADLTHNNFGAYWESGYAEGMGKPVIYICRQDKFDEDSTHFDTNHCTTVFWHSEENWINGVDEKFQKELKATLINSLPPSKG